MWHRIFLVFCLLAFLTGCAVRPKAKENNDSWLQVSIRNRLYRPVTFRIRKGTCTKVLLQNHKKTHSIKLAACYKNNILFLDSILLYFSPLWRNGFTYKNINLRGNVHLNNVTIKISEL